MCKIVLNLRIPILSVKEGLLFTGIGPRKSILISYTEQIKITVLHDNVIFHREYKNKLQIKRDSDIFRIMQTAEYLR